MGDSRSDISAKSFRVTNREGRSPVVLVCDHASNFVPAGFGSLGLTGDDLARHIAWDPGALSVCRHISTALDAVLVESCISRLVIDCNRPLDAPDLISPVSETTIVPGNADISEEERARRIALAYDPYHAAINDVVSERLERGQETWLIAVHSFTPVYKGVARPWHVGIIHDGDERLARPMISAISALDGVEVGINEPYSPADRVYFTLERHARVHELPCVMIEIRNDELSTDESCRLWADRIVKSLAAIDDATVTGRRRGPMEASIA